MSSYGLLKLGGVLAAAATLWVASSTQSYPLKAFTVTGRDCTFDPSRIEVDYRDRVKITFVAADGPHSFVIEEYRIARRATIGHPVTFEFLADQAGTFVYFSSLSVDEQCAGMRGELVVH